MSIATVNQLYNYTTSRDQHAFLPVLTTYIETDHKWQDVPPTVNTGGNAVQQSTFYLPTTLGELLGTMILRFNINISVSAAIAAGVLNMTRLTRFLALRAISNWTLSHQGRTIDEMSYNLDVLRIYYNLFQDDETFTDNLHMINGDIVWGEDQINDYVCTVAAGTAQSAQTVSWNFGSNPNIGAEWTIYSGEYNKTVGVYTFSKEMKGNKIIYLGDQVVKTNAFYVGATQDTAAASNADVMAASFYTPACAAVPGFCSSASTVTNLIIPVSIVIPWWGSWRTNNVLPIRNLNSQPRLDIQFQQNLTASIIDNLYQPGTSSTPTPMNKPLTVSITNPMLRCLYYRIPENIFATDFAFADQKNWIMPYYQHWQQDSSLSLGDNQFYVNTINQDVRSLVVVVRSTIDLLANRFDNFVGGEIISNMYLKHGNEYIGPRFNTETNFLLRYLKRKFYSHNTKDRQLVYGIPDIDPSRYVANASKPVVGDALNECRLSNTETPIFAFCFGMTGDINQPGMGSINFNDLLQNLTLTITVDPDLGTAPTGTYRIEVFALTNNIVTYDKGELMKQL